MSEGRNSRKDGKSGSPKERRKSEVESPKSGEENSAPPVGGPHSEIKGHSAIDTPRSELTKSDIEHPKSELTKSDIEHPKSEIKTKSDIEHPKSEIKELLTANSKLPTEPMEVHHHPEVEKKGLKEYLLEGLMIFLAVMLGFFAESLREYIHEQHEAQDYAVSLYSDIKADSSELHDYLTYFRRANANVDTLMQLLASKDARQIPSGELYYFGLFGGAYHVFTPHDATLLSMKNSGALRFFGDKAISRNLAVFDELCQNMKLTEEKDNGIYVEARKARAKIFEYKYNEMANDIYHGMADNHNTDPYGLTIASRWAKVDSFKKTNPPLLSYDKTLFNDYVEMVRSRFLNLKVASADTLLKHSTQLLILLRKKYDLHGE